MKKNSNTYLIDPEASNPAIRVILLWITLLVLIVQGVVSILLLRDGNYQDSTILAISMTPTLVGLVLIYYKHIQLAGGIITSALTLTITIVATRGEGIYDIGTMAFPVILIIASLILKRNTIIYLTGFIIACNAWLVFGDIYGLYQPLYPQQSYFRQFGVASLILVVTMVGVYTLSNMVRNSLLATRNELKERKKVEQALREAEAMYRTLVEQTSVIIYRDAPEEEGRTIYISPQIEDLLGYSIYEWQSADNLWKELTHPDDLPHVLSAIKDYLASGERTTIEYRMRTKDNRWVWLHDESIVIKDDDDKPLYVHGVLIDITERKIAEQKVKQREAVLSAVAQTAQQLLKASDWRDEIQSILGWLGEAANASHVYIFENHTGDADTPLSSMKYEWTAPGFTPELENPIFQNTKLIKNPDIEEWFTNLVNGKAFYGSKSEYPVFWEKALDQAGLITLLDMPIYVNGQWWGIIGFDDYINEKPWSQAEIDALTAAASSLGTAIERQEADEALRLSEEKFQLAFHHTFVPMVISRARDMVILDVNMAFCKGMGYTRDEATGKTADDLQLWIIPDEQTQHLNMLAGQDFAEELKTKFRHKDGETGVALVSAIKVYIAGEPCHLHTIYDISEIDRLVQELQAKNDELERFTYTVSHDLRAPLITVAGFVGYLEQDVRQGELEKIDKDVLRINEGIAKMQRLLTELLDLSRIGRMTNPPEDVPFEEIVHEALDLVEGRLKARQVQVSVEADLPSVFVDRARLVEVIQNLVDNASKFMGDQENPMIEIGAQADSGKPVFFVRDNGIGIAPQFHERVFGLFNKLDVESEGTGIGLALVKRIIEVHGGKIWVESELGKGTTFFFTLENKDKQEML